MLLRYYANFPLRFTYQTMELQQFELAYQVMAHVSCFTQVPRLFVWSKFSQVHIVLLFISLLYYNLGTSEIHLPNIATI